jgi:hypothetical protein
VYVHFGEFGTDSGCDFWHCGYEPARAQFSKSALARCSHAGSLPDLRWPDFSDDSTHVEKFYELNGGSLRWVQEWSPTQARQIIALMLQADQKGAPDPLAISTGPIPVMHGPASMDCVNPLRAR